MKRIYIYIYRKGNIFTISLRNLHYRVCLVSSSPAIAVARAGALRGNVDKKKKNGG